MNDTAAKNAAYYMEMSGELDTLFTATVLNGGAVTITERQRLAISSAIALLKAESRTWDKIAASA